MKKQFDIKKLVLLNLPYLLMGLFATNFGEAWRLAQGANASEKFLSLFAVLPGALQSFWPSLHPLDLLAGLCCGAGLRLAVYLNFYAVLKRQEMLDKEVYDIVHRNKKMAASDVRKNRGKNCAAGKDKEKAVPRR